MAFVPGLRRRSVAGDAVTDDDQITTYLHRVQSSLRVPGVQRARVMEEISNHLHDGAAEHMRAGEASGLAVAHAIKDLGPPDTVAAAFTDEGAEVLPSTGFLRWLPMLLPIAMLTATVGALAWSITFLANGLTVGERTVQLSYLRAAVVPAALTYGAYQSIKRADRDRAWRWAAWACTAGALTYLPVWR